VGPAACALALGECRSPAWAEGRLAGGIAGRRPPAAPSRSRGSLRAPHPSRRRAGPERDPHRPRRPRPEEQRRDRSLTIAPRSRTSSATAPPSVTAVCLPRPGHPWDDEPPYHGNVCFTATPRTTAWGSVPINWNSWPSLSITKANVSCVVPKGEQTLHRAVPVPSPFTA